MSSERKKELTAAIEAVDREIEVVTKPLKERRAQLAGELEALKLADIAERYGVGIGDLLLPTSKFRDDISSRSGWTADSKRLFMSADYLTLVRVDTDRSTCAVRVHGTASEAGNIEMSVIQDMRRAYLFTLRRRKP